MNPGRVSRANLLDRTIRSLRLIAGFCEAYRMNPKVAEELRMIAAEWEKLRVRRTERLATTDEVTR